MQVGDRVLWYDLEWEILSFRDHDTIEIFPVDENHFYFSRARPAWVDPKRVILLTDLIRALS